MMIESVALAEARINNEWYKVRVGNLHYDRRGEAYHRVEVVGDYTPFYSPSHGGPCWMDSGDVMLKDIRNQHQCSHKNLEYKYSWGEHDQVEDYFYCLDCHKVLVDAGGFMAVVR
jgi:hypothetical protein